MPDAARRAASATLPPPCPAAARTGSTSRLPVAASVLMAASFSSSGRSEERMSEARAISSALFTVPSVSFPSASSMAGSAAASRDFRTACAAESRLAGSALASSEPPAAAFSWRRSALLILILARSVLAASPAAAPVTGSVRASAVARSRGDEHLAVGLPHIEVALAQRVENFLLRLRLARQPRP